MSRAAATILVADDDRTMRLLARQSLEIAGLHVEEARSGRETLDQLTRNRPDLLLLDLDMPDLDGLTVCKHLRSLEEFQDLPVLIMTALDDVDTVQRAYQAGATDFIEKPPNWIVLGHRVRFILRASSAMRGMNTAPRTGSGL